MLHVKTKLFPFWLLTDYSAVAGSKYPIICYPPIKVLSSAEDIAVELATERACGWLSANIAGESPYPELALLTCVSFSVYSFSEIKG